VITYLATLSDGTQQLVYLSTGSSSDECNPFGSFENTTTLTDFDFDFELPDYQADCIAEIEGQATIIAIGLYNDQLNELQNQFLASLSECITSVDENFTMDYQLKEYQYTLYYYDLA